jgi:hypothetical protein
MKNTLLRNVSHLYRSSVKSLAKSPKHEYFVANFEIVTGDFFDRLEVLDFLTEESILDNMSGNAPDEKLVKSEVSLINDSSPPQFKMPNLEDFETKTRTTPKAPKYLSQSPVLVAKQKKRRKVAISSSDEEDEDFSVQEPAKKGKVEKIHITM